MRLALMVGLILASGSVACSPGTSRNARNPTPMTGASSPVVDAQGTPVPRPRSADSPPASAKGESKIMTLCDADEDIVFSCPLVRPKKIVSLCAKKMQGDGWRLRYLFGKPGKPELTYPEPEAANTGTFTRSFLGYAGNTGGYAYTFVNSGFKYILYSVSGAYDFEDSGVYVQPQERTEAATHMECSKNSLVEYSSDVKGLQKMLFDLAQDPDIVTYGLPDAEVMKNSH